MGYKHWLDCNPEAEAKHGATVFLDRALYAKVRGWQAEKAAEHWGKIWNLNLELNGMDAKAADARVKQLRLVRDKYAAELRALQDQVELLTKRIAVADGQIAEREIDIQMSPPEPKTLKASDSPKPNFVGRLPIFDSEEQAQKALANRGKGPGGEDAAEAERLREPVSKKAAEEFLGALDGPAA